MSKPLFSDVPKKAVPMKINFRVDQRAAAAAVDRVAELTRTNKAAADLWTDLNLQSADLVTVRAEYDRGGLLLVTIRPGAGMLAFIDHWDK